MANRHGVYTSEIPTSIIPPVNTVAGLPVVFGTAPVHLATSRVAANKPILCYSYKEAVEQLGFSDDWQKYTLCEVMYSQFALYNRAPVVFVNVLDPEKHKEKVTTEELHITNGQAVITDPALPETLVVKQTSVNEPAKAGKDYEAAHDDKGNLVINILKDGDLKSLDHIYVEYYKLTPESVDKTDIIGGVDISTGKLKGLELLDSVFTRFRLVPGIVMAPGYSSDPGVAAVMAAKATNIVDHFKAVVLCDAAPDVVKYTDVVKWKNDNNFVDGSQYVCWPFVKNGDKVYHMSTHVLGGISTVDSSHEDVPFESPSNKLLRITGICDKNGNEIELDVKAANYLNGQGIASAINFVNGWVLWGNRMACYPGNTDPKDAFLCVRRMFNWHAQTFTLTYWRMVDGPITKRLAKTIVDSENIRLNGLVAQEYILGGRVEFQEGENPTTSLIDGKIKFHTYLTPPTPAREISNVIEFDPEYFKNLFN